MTNKDASKKEFSVKSSEESSEESSASEESSEEASHVIQSKYILVRLYNHT